VSYYYIVSSFIWICRIRFPFHVACLQIY